MFLWVGSPYFRVLPYILRMEEPAQVQGGGGFGVWINSADEYQVPFGAGSSVEGNFSTPYSGLSIDFGRMNNIIAFHPDEYVRSMKLYGTVLII